MADKNITLKRKTSSGTDNLYPSTTWGQIDSSTIPSTFTPTSHTHGNINDDGRINTSSIIATGDHLIIADHSSSNDLTGSSITFDTSNSTDFLRKDGTFATPAGTVFNGGTITNDLTISNDKTILMSGDYYINKRFDMLENASPQYILLCASAANNEVMGTIHIDRSSSNWQAAMLDVVVTARSNDAVQGAALRTLQVLQSGERYDIVRLTYSSTQYIAVRYTGNLYPETTARFTGRMKSTGSASLLTVVGSSDVSSVNEFDGTTYSFQDVDTMHFRGNVGIGTDSPSAKLDVNGALFLKGRVFGDSDGTNTYLKSGTSGKIYFETNGGTRGGIDASGNFGIGTLSPSARLEVIGDIKIKQGSGYNNYGLIDQTEALMEIDTYSVNTSAYPADIVFRPNLTERVRITDDGNVGIGTTTPSAKLHIIETTAGADIAKFRNNGDTGDVTIKTSGEVGIVKGGAGDQLQLSANGTDNNGIRITTAGKVGIGTTSPTNTLQVDGNARVTNFMAGDAAATNVPAKPIHIKGAGEQALRIEDTNSSNQVFDITVDKIAGFKIKDITNSLTPFAISNAGDVTITGDLNVSGSFTTIDTDTSTTEQWSVTNDGTGPAVIINQKGAQPIIDIQDDSTTVFKIFDGGNVGIDSTTTYHSLQVGQMVSTTTIGTVGIKSNGSGYAIIMEEPGTSSETYAMGVDSAGNLNFHNSGSSTPAVRFMDNDNVGIGQQSPAQKLDVNGITRVYQSGQTALKTYSAQAGLQLVGYQSTSGSPYTKTSDIVANADGTVASAMRFFTKASGSSSATEQMRIESDGTVQFNADRVRGKSVNGERTLLDYWGGIRFTWDSDTYGNNDHHSIRSTYGNTWGDDLTINSFHHLRVNLDANNNNTDARFEIGHNTTGTGNELFTVSEQGYIDFHDNELRNIGNANIFDTYRRDTIDSASEDFNDFTTSGTYAVNNWSQSGDVVQNGPTNTAAGNAYGWGMLRVTNFQSSTGDASGYVVQEYIPHVSDTHYVRFQWNGTWTSWRAAWGSDNDGAGSGLDADKVDGLQASQFVRSDASDTMTGSLTLSSASYIEMRVNQTDSGYIRAGVSSGTAEGFIDSTGNGSYAGQGKIKFLTEGSEKARIDTNGNLGIGTTNPSHGLDVHTGSIRALSSSSAKIWVESTGGSQASLELKNSEGHFRFITDNGEYHIYDQIDAAERFRITTTGNVQLNSSKIQLNANGNILTHGNLYLNSDNTNADSFIYFGDSASDTAHNLSFDVSAQQFNFTNKVIASNGRLSSVESNGSDVDKVNFQLSGTTLTITTS